MAISYFDTKKEYILNHFRWKRFNDGFLVATDFGSWVFLNEDEFRKLRNGKIADDANLFNVLENKGIILTEDNFENISKDLRRRLRFLFRGTYNHVIFLNSNKKENINKITNFIIQSPSRHLIIDFKGNLVENFGILKEFIVEFDKIKSKIFHFRIFINNLNLSNEIIKFVKDENIAVWFEISDVLDYLKIKDLNNKIKINLILNFSKKFIGNEKELIFALIDIGIKNFMIKLSDEDGFFEFWKNCFESVNEINFKGKDKVINEVLSEIFLSKILTKEDVFYPEFHSICTGDVISQLAYDLDGDIYVNEEAFGMEIFKIGNVNMKYSDVLKNPDVQTLLKVSIEKDIALDNDVFWPYIGVSPVYNYKEYGNLLHNINNKRTKVLKQIVEYLFLKILNDEIMLLNSA